MKKLPIKLRELFLWYPQFPAYETFTQNSNFSQAVRLADHWDDGHPDDHHGIKFDRPAHYSERDRPGTCRW